MKRGRDELKCYQRGEMERGERTGTSKLERKAKVKTRLAGSEDLHCQTLSCEARSSIREVLLSRPHSYLVSPWPHRCTLQRPVSCIMREWTVLLCS